MAPMVLDDRQLIRGGPFRPSPSNPDREAIGYGSRAFFVPAQIGQATLKTGTSPDEVIRTRWTDRPTA